MLLHTNRMTCPHCSSACRTVRTSIISPLTKTLTLVCSNPDCQAIFAADLTIAATIQPSKTPNDAVHIPALRERARHTRHPGV